MMIRIFINKYAERLQENENKNHFCLISRPTHWVRRTKWRSVKWQGIESDDVGRCNRKRGRRRRKVGVRLNKHCVHDFWHFFTVFYTRRSVSILCYLRIFQIASQAPIATSFHHLYKLMQEPKKWSFFVTSTSTFLRAKENVSRIKNKRRLGRSKKKRNTFWSISCFTKWKKNK